MLMSYSRRQHWTWISSTDIRDIQIVGVSISVQYQFNIGSISVQYQVTKNYDALPIKEKE